MGNIVQEKKAYGDKISVAYASSDMYAFLAGTSILSLCENNKHIHELNIYILDVGIGIENRIKLNQISEFYGRKIEYISVNNYIEKLKKYGMTEYNGSYATCMKLLITEYFSDEIERLLYIDCDTMIRGPIDALWNCDMGNKCLGMTIDCMNSKLKKGYGMLANQKYCSGALVLYDMKRYRQFDCTTKIIMFLRKNKIKFPFVEQDVLNMCLVDWIYILPIKYNFISLYEKFSINEIYQMYNLDEEIFYNKKEYDNAKINPIIVHFPSVYFSRPWYTDCISGWTGEYDKYLYAPNNPYHNFAKGRSNMGFMSKVQQFLSIHLTRKFFVILEKIASNINTSMVLKKAKKEIGISDRN